MKLLSFVIPVYNSAATIKDLCQRIVKTYQSQPYRIEILLINDGSTDNSGIICQQLSADYFPQVKCFSHPKNLGQHQALLTGLSQARGDLVICLDDDLQTPPEESLKLVKAAKVTNFDVIYGQFSDQSNGFFRYLGTQLNNLTATLLLGKPKNVKLTSFCLLHKVIVKKITNYRTNYPYLPAMVLRITKNIGGVPVKHLPRSRGKSGYTFGKLIKLWLRLFLYI